MNRAEIVIGADIVASKENQMFFQKGVPEMLIGQQLWQSIRDADVRIFNLESAVCNRGEKIKKAGPHIKMSPGEFEGVVSLRPSILSIANNHVMDYGADGLFETIQNIEKHHISYLGAGKNLNEAKKPLIIEVSGIKIGFYACAEHEFSIAGEDSPGCNPYDPLNTFDHIEQLKSMCDYVIVLYHGGKELYRYPSPDLQKVCRKMSEKGADFVVCQHSHCVGAVEQYGSSTIVYGQGNFLFYEEGCEAFMTGTLIKLNLEKADVIKSRLDILPLHTEGYTVSIATGEEGNRILRGLECRSEEIKDAKFIVDNYAMFAKENANAYFYNLCGNMRYGFFFRALNKLTRKRILEKMFRGDALVLNMIECEAHREMITRILKEEIR